MEKINKIILKEEAKVLEESVNTSTPRKAPPSGSGSGGGNYPTSLVSGSGTAHLSPVTVSDGIEYQWILEGEFTWAATAQIELINGVWCLNTASIELNSNTQASIYAAGREIQMSDNKTAITYDAGPVNISFQNILNQATGGSSITLVGEIRQYGGRIDDISIPKPFKVSFYISLSPNENRLMADFGTITVL